MEQHGVDSGDTAQVVKFLGWMMDRAGITADQLQTKDKRKITAKENIGDSFRMGFRRTKTRVYRSVLAKRCPEADIVTEHEITAERKRLVQEHCAVSRPLSVEQQAVIGGKAGKQGRCTWAEEVIVSILKSVDLQPLWNFKDFDGKVHWRASIDGARITTARGLELGFGQVLNLTELRHAPQAMFPCYIAEHRESADTMARVLSESLLHGLEGDNPTLTYNCCGEECAFCKYKRSTKTEYVPAAKHTVEVVKHLVNDLAATLSLLGL